MDTPPRDGREFWAIVKNQDGRRWPEPIKLHWYRVSGELRDWWGGNLDGFSGGGFDMALWRGDATIAEWWRD